LSGTAGILSGATPGIRLVFFAAARSTGRDSSADVNVKNTFFVTHVVKKISNHMSIATIFSLLTIQLGRRCP